MNFFKLMIEKKNNTFRKEKKYKICVYIFFVIHFYLDPNLSGQKTPYWFEQSSFSPETKKITKPKISNRLQLQVGVAVVAIVVFLGRFRWMIGGRLWRIIGVHFLWRGRVDNGGCRNDIIRRKMVPHFTMLLTQRAPVHATVHHAWVARRVLHARKS